MKRVLQENHVWTTFLLRRIVRLYPAYIFAVSLSAVGCLILTNFQLSYPENFWLPTGKIDFWNIVGHITVIGSFDVMRFDNPIWSIVYEMRFSLLFPLFYFVVERLGKRTLWLVIAGPTAVSLALSFPSVISNHDLSNIILTIHYGSFFLLGALIARYRMELIKYLLARSSAVKAILVLSLALYTYSSVGELSLSGECLTDVLAAAGSAGIIVLSLRFPVLEKIRVCRWLGKISYSLYLTHAPVLAAAYELYATKMPFLQLWIIMIAASLMLSTITWYLVEAPSLRCSRSIGVELH